jgi:hypothetical protein
MKYLTRLVVLFLCLRPFGVVAQEEYLAGTGKATLQPGDESFSLALSGYAGPWEGRFILKWIPKGKSSEYLELIKGNRQSLSSSLQKAVDREGFQKVVSQQNTLYGLARDGSLKASVVQKKGNLSWNALPPLSSVKDFVVYNNYLYAADGTDVLWKISLTNTQSGWHRAGYDNQLTQKVKIQRLLVGNSQLYAVNEADSLFLAGKNLGLGDEEPFATALAIRKNGQTVLVLGLDLCGFNSDFTDEIKKELSVKTGIAPHAILINASHTHFVPGTQQWLTWAPHNRLPDENYMTKVVKPGILKAAREAVETLRPSTIYFGRGTTKIGKNRSNGGNPEPYDDAVDVVKVVRKDGKGTTVLVLSGCHPVAGTEGIRHFTVSANYPGYMRGALKTKLGSSTNALFLQGCGGDINPKEAPELTGVKLADDALKVLEGSMTPLEGNLSFAMDTLQAPTAPWSKEKIEAFRDENQKLGPGMEPERDVAWADIMLKHIANGTMPIHMPIYIHTINVGNWKLIGLSREVVTEYSLAIKKIWPGKLVSVAGYCNDVSSYLPVERHITTGVYEGHGSYFWYGQPSSFPLNILDLVVNRIKAGNH